MKSNRDLSTQLKTLRAEVQLKKSQNYLPSPVVDIETTELSVPLPVIIREKDREIDALKLELADIEVRLAEQASSALLRTRQVEDALLQSKLENIRLAEDVESYQMLLHDRTIKGEYSIPGLEEFPGSEDIMSTRSVSPPHSDQILKKTSLAAELEEADPDADSLRIRGNLFLGYDVELDYRSST